MCHAARLPRSCDNDDDDVVMVQGEGYNMMLSGAGLLDSIRSHNVCFWLSFRSQLSEQCSHHCFQKQKTLLPRALDSRSLLLKAHSGSNRDLSPQEGTTNVEHRSSKQKHVFNLLLQKSRKSKRQPKAKMTKAYRDFTDTERTFMYSAAILAQATTEALELWLGIRCFFRHLSTEAKDVQPGSLSSASSPCANGRSDDRTK